MGLLEEQLEAVTGLSRVRLAELLYEHEGFVDLAEGNYAPDRVVPSWIEQSQAQQHIGDCTGLPMSCMTCHATMALEQWDALVALMARARHALALSKGSDT